MPTKLVRDVQPWANADLFGFVAARGRPGQRLWVGHLPGARGAWAALGTVLGGNASAGESLRILAGRYSHALELETHGAPRNFDTAPLWLGGAAFANAPLGPPWEGFATASLWIPAELLWIDADAKAWHIVHRLEGQPPPLPDAAALADRTGRPQASPAADRRADPVAEADSFVTAVQRAVLRLGAPSAAEHLDKVVLARSVRLAAPRGEEPDVAATFVAAAARHPDAFCFAVGHTGGEVFVGATPELLVERSGDTLRTRALAGTAPRHADPRLDKNRGRQLLDSDKDRREHAWVVDALRQGLASPGAQVRADETTLRSTPDVWHLETTLTASGGADPSLLGAVDRLHPSPAVAGSPRAAALRCIGDSETFERGWYAGPLGYLDGRGDGAFWVGIRSALLDSTGAWLFAGAGIVHGSVAADEYQETELKLAAMRQALRFRPTSGAARLGPSTPRPRRRRRSAPDERC